MRPLAMRWLVLTTAITLFPGLALAAFDQSTPRAVYDSLLDVFREGDTAGYALLLQPDARKRVQKELENDAEARELKATLKILYNELKSRTVEKVVVNGDKASLVLAAQTDAGDGAAPSATLDFVKIDNLWYYAPAIATGSSDEPKKPQNGKSAEPAKTNPKPDAGSTKEETENKVTNGATTDGATKDGNKAAPAKDDASKEKSATDSGEQSKTDSTKAAEQK